MWVSVSIMPFRALYVEIIAKLWKILDCKIICENRSAQGCIKSTSNFQALKIRGMQSNEILISVNKFLASLVLVPLYINVAWREMFSTLVIEEETRLQSDLRCAAPNAYQAESLSRGVWCGGQTTLTRSISYLLPLSPPLLRNNSSHTFNCWSAGRAGC
jgi:hypothetical protein